MLKYALSLKGRGHKNTTLEHAFGLNNGTLDIHFSGLLGVELYEYELIHIAHKLGIKSTVN